MKVMMVPSWYETEDKPGKGTFFKEQAMLLQESGLTIAVAYPDLRPRLGGMRKGVFRDYGAKVPTYYCRQSGFTAFTEQSKSARRGRMLEELYERVCRDMGKPDLVHLLSCRLGPEAAALCARHGLPLVYTEHTGGLLRSPGEGAADSVLKRCFRKTLQECDLPIAVSEDLRAQMVTARPDTLLIPDPVDSGHFRIMPGVVPEGPFVFAASGSLLPDKGFEILLRGFASALPHMQGAQLRIAGTGPQERELEVLIGELRLSENVRLTGPLPRALSPKFYNGCDCFVCASFSEPFGMPIVEALACGRPVISTRCGGPEEIVNARNGLLINAGDVLAMERALIYMYRRAKSFNPFTLREDCIRRFGKSFVCQRLVQAYGYLLNQRTLAGRT